VAGAPRSQLRDAGPNGNWRGGSGGRALWRRRDPGGLLGEGGRGGARADKAQRLVPRKTQCTSGQPHRAAASGQACVSRAVALGIPPWQLGQGLCELGPAP
jgi:hypothetical protein